MNAKREKTIKEKRGEKAICGLMFFAEKENKHQNTKGGIVTKVWICQERKEKKREEKRRKETSKNVKQTKPKQKLVSK